MSTLKDKLANSVRQAKSAAHAPEARPRAAERTRTAPAKPVAPATTVPARSGTSPDAQNPAPSADQIFPRRVWPD